MNVLVTLYLLYLLFLLFQENKSFGASTICIHPLCIVGNNNYVKVVWFDRPWLGESPADIHNLFNCPFNFILK